MQHLLSLALLLTSCLSSHGAVCPWEDDSLLKWSEPSTWDTGELPSGQEERLLITVPIKLDIVTPALKQVIIGDGGQIGLCFKLSLSSNIEDILH